MPMVVVENADPAAFGGDVHAVTAGVVGQHVGGFADCLVVNHVPVGQVHCDHGGVGFTADEHHLAGDVESLPVRVIAAGCGNPFCHSETDRVYDGQVVAALHRDHHLIEERVVHDVSHLTAQWDGGADCAGVGIDHRFGARTLVGRPHRAPSRVVGQSIGIGVGRGAKHDLAGVFVYGDHLVGSGRGRIHPMIVGNHDHPMYVGQIRQRPKECACTSTSMSSPAPIWAMNSRPRPTSSAV